VRTAFVRENPAHLFVFVVTEHLAGLKRAALLRHELGEVFLAVAKALSHNHSGIVSRLGDNTLDCILNGDRLAWLQVELAWRCSEACSETFRKSPR
jgi:hypothetical protein